MPSQCVSATRFRLTDCEGSGCSCVPQTQARQEMTTFSHHSSPSTGAGLSLSVLICPQPHKPCRVVMRALKPNANSVGTCRSNSYELYTTSKDSSESSAKKLLHQLLMQSTLVHNPHLHHKLLPSFPLTSRIYSIRNPTSDAIPTTV